MNVYERVSIQECVWGPGGVDMQECLWWVRHHGMHEGSASQ